MNFTSRFSGKVALVTGATSGIGRATAIAYAREGAKVVIAGRRIEEGNAVARAIAGEGGEALFVKTDVTRESDIVALISRTVERFGRLDIAFNNAGWLGKLAPTPEQTNENYGEVFDANVRGVFWSMKYEIPAMLISGGGAIVNTASIGGSIGFPDFGLYVASKHAVIGLTRSAALEYARRGIRVNTVSPAGIQTDMLDTAFGVGDTDHKKSMAELHPIGRLGSSEEVADAVLYLSAPGASFVTGHDLLVDGAFTVR